MRLASLLTVLALAVALLPHASVGQVSPIWQQAALQLQSEARIAEVARAEAAPLRPSAGPAVVSMAEPFEPKSLEPTGRFIDPERAQLLSTILPGAGQVYAGNYGDGITAMIATPGAVALGVLLSEPWTCDQLCSPSEIAPLFVGVVASATLWRYTIIQSPKDARRANAERHVATGLSAMSSGNEVRPAITVSVKW